MKALVGTFNQEKALVGAFSVIVKTGCGTDGSICGTSADDVLTAQVPEDGGRRHGAGRPPAPAAVRGGGARVAAGADHLLLALAGDHHDHQVSQISRPNIIMIPKHISTSSRSPRYLQSI